MPNVWKVITEFARARSAEGWKALAAERFDELRVLVRENGEKSALVAFGVGILVVFFFKLFLIIVALSALAFLTILWLADS
ncbi:MAG: hypothetical protein RL518_2454 [Pseudomonadota bacterium]|jgi:hypothetical protein